MILQPTGMASAGLSAGFTILIERFYHLIPLIIVGMIASFLRGFTVILLPLMFVLMYVIGSLVMMERSAYPMQPMFVFGATMIFAVCMALIQTRIALVAAAAVASLAFHMGMYYAQLVPPIASPMYFLLGNILSLALILSTAVSFGLTLKGDIRESQDARRRAYDEATHEEKSNRDSSGYLG